MSRFVAASPEAAWRLLSSTATWTRWGPSVTAVRPAAGVVSPGMIGRVRVPLGLWLPFTITAVEPHRSWSWSVVGIPATSHEVDAAPGGCRVSFGVPPLAAPYLVVCRVALRRIATALEAGGGEAGYAGAPDPAGRTVSSDVTG